MTTETQAKRTEGELVFDGSAHDFKHHGGQDVYIKGGPQICSVYGAPHHDRNTAFANAEYIRKAWNMHEELVAGCETAMCDLFRVMNPSLGDEQKPTLRSIHDELAALLTRCQQQELGQ